MGIISKVRDKADDKVDAVLDMATAKAYEGYYARWMEICEVQTKEEIDYTLPCIEIESKLCDPRNLKMIKKGKHTGDFLKLLSSD